MLVTTYQVPLEGKSHLGLEMPKAVQGIYTNGHDWGESPPSPRARSFVQQVRWLLRAMHSFTPVVRRRRRHSKADKKALA